MDEEEKKSSQHKSQHNFPFHHQFHHEHHIKDVSSNESLAKVLRNLGTSIRQQQQEMATTMSSSSSSVKSLNEEKFTSTQQTCNSYAASSSSSTAAAMKTTTTTSSTMETTGGKEVQNDSADEKMNTDSECHSELCASPIGKITVFPLQQQKQQQNMATMRVKTLSFLHNEDLLSTTMGTSLAAPVCNIMSFDDKSAAIASSSSSLYRSMSFQERRQYQHQAASLKRVESGKEFKTTSGSIISGESNLRKVTILSPKHSLQELNERIKNMQQQMFYGSSELSL